jgi:hypothetical protein
MVLNASALPAQSKLRGRADITATLRTLKRPGIQLFEAAEKEVGITSGRSH